MGPRSAGPVGDPPALDSGGPVGGEAGSSPGAGCSGALEPPAAATPESLGPAAGAPESLGPDGEDPDSLDPPGDGSNSIAPEDEPESLDDDDDDDDPESLEPADDEPESLDDPESLGAMGNGGGDAAAVRTPKPNPSRLASTPQVTAMPASNRFALKVASGRLRFSGLVGRRTPSCAAGRIG
jgi:hypothetical protein